MILFLAWREEALIIALRLSKTALQTSPSGILLMQVPGSQLTSETFQLGLS